MTSPSVAPQLSPVREFAPFDLKVRHDENVDETATKLSDTRISEIEQKVTEKLESGAPVTKAEAKFMPISLLKAVETLLSDMS
jgi:hypothetical protein